MKSKDWKLSLWKRTTESSFHFGILPCLSILKASLWRRTTTLKNMNWKTVIPKLALVALALSAPTALSQEFLIITGKRTNGTIFYREVSPDVEDLFLHGRNLTQITLPEDLTNLKLLTLSDNQLTSLTLPAGLTSLEDLDLYNNRLISLSLPPDLASLEWLWLSGNQLTEITLPAGLISLKDLYLDKNSLTSLDLPPGLSNLEELQLDDNPLTSLSLPAGMMSLKELRLPRFTSISYPDDWKLLPITGKRANDRPPIHLEVSPSLESLDLIGEHLTSLTLPEGLISLKELYLWNNPIESLFVPEEVDIGNLRIEGFSKENIIRYVPDSVFLELVIWREEDGRVVIVFSGGVLQAAEGVFEEWEDVSNAVSPFYINPAEATQRFFRVRFAR